MVSKNLIKINNQSAIFIEDILIVKDNLNVTGDKENGKETIAKLAQILRLKDRHNRNKTDEE